jgi:hypothetical protein
MLGFYVMIGLRSSLLRIVFRSRTQATEYFMTLVYESEGWKPIITTFTVIHSPETVQQIFYPHSRKKN